MEENWKPIKGFESKYEKTSVCPRDILYCINNTPKRKSAGGYIWKSEVVNSDYRHIENGEYR